MGNQRKLDSVLPETFKGKTYTSQPDSQPPAIMSSQNQNSIYGNSIQTGWNNGKFIISYNFTDIPMEANDTRAAQLRMSHLNMYLQQCEFSKVELGESTQFTLITRTNYDENHNEHTVIHSVKLISGQLICTPATPNDHFLFRLDCTVAPIFIDHDALYIEWSDLHLDMQSRVFQTSEIGDSKVCMILYHEKPGAAAKQRVVDRYKKCIQKTNLNGKYIISYAFPDLEDREIDDNDERIRFHVINRYLRMFRFSKVEFGEDDRYALVTKTHHNQNNNSQSVSKSLKIISGKLICTPSTKDEHYCFQLDNGISPLGIAHEDLYEGWCVMNPHLQCRVFETSNIDDSKISRCLFHAKPK